MVHDLKPLVIYHSPCMDGFTAAWACWLIHPDWEYFSATHGNPAPDVTGREVYFLDFSYKEGQIRDMLEVAKSITVLDHHASAKKELETLLRDGEISGVFDMDKSGARLAWEHFHPGSAVPMFVETVEDRDLWRFKFPNTKPLCAYIFSFEYSFETWNKIHSQFQSSTGMTMMLVAGEGIERKHQKDVTELVKRTKHRTIIAGFDVPIANLPYTYASDAGHLMCEGEPFAAICYYTPDGWEFSLRSEECGEDVSEIARTFGGGGHKHAAGFRLRVGNAWPLLAVTN